LLEFTWIRRKSTSFEKTLSSNDRSTIPTLREENGRYRAEISQIDRINHRQCGNLPEVGNRSSCRQQSRLMEAV
jgi:hypothetical protein